MGVASPRATTPHRATLLRATLPCETALWLFHDVGRRRKLKGWARTWMSHHQIPRLDGNQAERCDGNLPFASRLMALLSTTVIGRDRLLSDPALAILYKMHNGTQGELIFPNPDDGMFSENAMLAVLDRLGYSHVTEHGFRSTFATWAEECTEYPDGVREAALAHKYKSETTAAYQRGQKLEKRRILMKDWAQFLAGSNVIRFNKTG